MNTEIHKYPINISIFKRPFMSIKNTVLLIINSNTSIIKKIVLILLFVTLLPVSFMMMMGFSSVLYIGKVFGIIKYIPDGSITE